MLFFFAKHVLMSEEGSFDSLRQFRLDEHDTLTWTCPFLAETIRLRRVKQTETLNFKNSKGSWIKPNHLHCSQKRIFPHLIINASFFYKE